MKKDEIHFDDWYRMLIGQVPFSFFVEAAIRIIIIYLLLIFSMRLMGKRMASQLSRNEMAAMVTLAAAIGVPMQAPDRGLLPAFVICLVVVLVERGISYWAYKRQWFEKFSQGNIGELVRFGVMQMTTMKKARITRARVMSQLRSEGIKHLGEVKRLYLEAGGDFTLIKEEKPKAGLSTIPGWDADFADRQEKDHELLACCTCGYLSSKKEDRPCPNCGDANWISAVK